MRLESVDEIRAQGVTVCPHVVEPAQPLDVSRLAVPDWARWTAADSYGHVFAYSHRPSNEDGTAWTTHNYTYCMFIGIIDMTGIDWRRTLTPVQPTQPWCEQCNLPLDICRGHDEHLRAHGRLPVNVLAHQLAQLSPDDISALARQLVAADESQCDRLIDALIGAFEMQPKRQRATELAAVVEVERRRTFVLELQKAINAVIDGVLRRTQ